MFVFLVSSWLNNKYRKRQGVIYLIAKMQHNKELRKKSFQFIFGLFLAVSSLRFDPQTRSRWAHL